MGQQARIIVNQVLGVDHAAQLSSDGRRQLFERVDRMIAERGEIDARNKLRREEILRRKKAQAQEARPRTQEGEKTDPYGVGASILQAATMKAVIDTVDAAQEKAEPDESVESPYNDPFAMQDPKPDYL